MSRSPSKQEKQMEIHIQRVPYSIFEVWAEQTLSTCFSKSFLSLGGKTLGTRLAFCLRPLKRYKGPLKWYKGPLKWYKGPLKRYMGPLKWYMGPLKWYIASPKLVHCVP